MYQMKSGIKRWTDQHMEIEFHIATQRRELKKKPAAWHKS